MGKMVAHDKILELLKTLVEIESLSKKEGEIRAFVREYLKNLGYELYEGEHFLATKGQRELIVATHLDTVSIRRPFSWNGDYAYGTGVCDAKGSVAAMLLSAEEGLDYTLAFFCDEEEDGLGSKEFVSQIDNGKYAIVMEPTDLKIASRHYGNFELYVEIFGKEAHGAYPEEGLNAIHLFFQLYQKLLERGFKINPLRIEAGDDLYVIPAKCKAKIEIFLHPEEKLEEYLKNLEFLKEYGKIELDHLYEGYVSKEINYLLEEALRQSGLPVRYTEMKSWTDALNLKERFDVVVWGPGDLTKCHTEEEYIKIKDIELAAKTLSNLNRVFRNIRK